MSSEYIFFGYEVLYGRVGLDHTLKDMTLENENNRIEEIKQIYKDHWGYNDVIIKKDINDPYMVLVYVKPNKPFGTYIYRY